MAGHDVGDSTLSITVVAMSVATVVRRGPVDSAMTELNPHSAIRSADAQALQIITIIPEYVRRHPACNHLEPALHRIVIERLLRNATETSCSSLRDEESRLLSTPSIGLHKIRESGGTAGSFDVIVALPNDHAFSGGAQAPSAATRG